ncbi:programmed cell death protein 4-like [Dorcoceras hygrometricum]|uniref:Programmed cell death protein 4-like n=1 Tax=Dorcoceras hygrometricum TaxID=472368 RepID=A0A2Z7DEX5_9LAMI|nr:programmed cell death protein 4-like [Dorcoceras hygrometricum]
MTTKRVPRGRVSARLTNRVPFQPEEDQVYRSTAKKVQEEVWLSTEVRLSTAQIAIKLAIVDVDVKENQDTSLVALNRFSKDVCREPCKILALISPKAQSSEFDTKDAISTLEGWMDRQKTELIHRLDQMQVAFSIKLQNIVDH